MSELSPIQNGFIEAMADIQATTNRQAIARQPFLGDWLDYSNPLEYFSATEVRTSNTGIDLTDFWSVGDPIRYKQGGGYKYGYVTYVESTRMRVRAGDDYSVADAELTEVARGEKLNAEGFPIRFAIPSSNIQVSVGTITLSANSGDTQLEFYMIGNTIFLELVTIFATITVSTAIIFVLPTNIDSVTNRRAFNWNDAASGGTWGMAIENQDVPSAGLDSLLVYESAAAAPYPTGAGNVNFTISHNYKVGDS